MLSKSAVQEGLLRADLGSIKTRNFELQGALSHKSAEKDSLRTKLEEMADKNLKNETALSKANRVMALFQDELKALRLEGLESEKDFAKTAREKNFLRAELQKANHECFEKGENLSGVYAEKKTLQAELRRTVTKASENEKAWLEQVAETSKLEDQLKTQNSTIDRYVNTIQALQSKMNVLNNEALVRNANNPKTASLQSQNAGLKDRNAQQQKALAEMTERLNEAELTAKEAVTDLLVCNDDLEAKLTKRLPSRTPVMVFRLEGLQSSTITSDSRISKWRCWRQNSKSARTISSLRSLSALKTQERSTCSMKLFWRGR